MTTALLSRTPAQDEQESIFTTPTLSHVPTICLTTATPSSSEIQATPPVLAPKAQSDNRKRLVPKKSKLSLLSNNKREKILPRDNDSETHRVGLPPPTGRTFSIYVDPADDPDIGEIVVLKKKKSRAGLNEVQWNALGDVTNTGESKVNNSKRSNSDVPIKPKKDEERDKWWTLGRGRSDSKVLKAKLKENEVGKENKNSTVRRSRQSTPAEQIVHPDTRQRSQSFDAGMFLNAPSSNFITVPMPDDDESPIRTHARTDTSPSLYESGPRVPSTLSSHQTITEKATEKVTEDKKRARSGSITLRAIRSVKSLARMSSWAQLKNPTNSEVESEDEEKIDRKGSKRGLKTEKKEHKKETKEGKKERKKRNLSIRGSISSFEALKNHFGSVKMGVNFSGTLRSVSSQSTTSDSSEGTIRDASRRQSGSSTTTTQSSDSSYSDIEPIIGRASKSSGASSIRWTDQVETIREQDGQELNRSRKRNGSKRTPEGRRRPALASLFFNSEDEEEPLDSTPRARKPPALSLRTSNMEFEAETSATLLDISANDTMDTPVKKVRPVSEQVGGCNRSKVIVGDTDTGAICTLDAATSDLASLINRLDLEATPTASPRNSPGASKVFDSRFGHILESSPLKASTQTSQSLRSYAHHRAVSESVASPLGQKIAPWPIPEREDGTPASLVKHKWSRSLSMSLSKPYEGSPVFHPLPAPSRPRSRESLLTTSKVDHLPELPSVVSSSFTTFGKQSLNSKPTKGSRSSTRVGKRSKGSRGSVMAQLDASDSIFLDESTKRSLGMRGTLGSVGSTSSNFDPNDPDGDIPKELQVLLNDKSAKSPSFTGASERGLLFEHVSASIPLPPSPGSPPSIALPSIYDGVPPEEFDEVDDGIFDRLNDENETKKSFDFTGELKKLTSSGAADNKSFVMQLEDAFRTPPKFSPLRFHSRFVNKEESIPDVPPIPEMYQPIAQQDKESESSLSPNMSTDGCTSKEDSFTSESHDEDDINNEDMCIRHPPLSALHSIFGQSSGTLNLDFKFGGESNPSGVSEGSEDGERHSKAKQAPAQLPRSRSFSSLNSAESGRNIRSMSDLLVSFSQHSRSRSFVSLNSALSKPMTLSDIIPPPFHESRRHSYISVNDEENSILKSIYAKANEISSNISVAESPVNTDGASISEIGDRHTALDRLVAHSRQHSEVSFSGLSSFSEIRRGFEYTSSLPTFYPPSSISIPVSDENSNIHLQPPEPPRWRDSLYSIASVSSYGCVTRPGVQDPFEFGAPVRPLSEELSFTVEDTFSFMRPGAQRLRIDGDISNFQFQVPPQLQAFAAIHQRRTRRQVESIYSVASGPPVSLYNNRGFSVYSQNRNSNGASLGKYHNNNSSDSLASEFSAHRLGRPGIGDKMFDSARDHGVPLPSISASPSQAQPEQEWQATFDSIMDGNSILEEAERRSLSSESVFGQDKHHIPPQAPGLLPPGQFRPLSTYSFMSNNSPKRDDDTMISMLGGGYVRRRSIGSAIEGSPCMRAEKRRPKIMMGRALTRIPSGDAYDFGEESVNGSPDRARSFISRLSGSPIASIKPVESPLEASPIVEANADQNRLSVYFGDNRMSMARKGLLERQSLEQFCLSGDGEENSHRRSIAIFQRPEPAARTRGASVGQSYTVNGSDTPPLSATSSRYTDSQGSFDLNRLNAMLNGLSSADASINRSSSKLRASNHRRRISEARASRSSSVYETIDEEAVFATDSISYMGDHLKSSVNSSVSDLAVSSIKIRQWDNDDTGPALRMIYALQEEARQAVDASQRQYADTAFSLDALQSFRPPSNISVWKTLLEHSQKTYGPLPQELHGCARTTRTRTVSRPSPYPRNRVFFAPDEQPVLPKTAMLSGKLAPLAKPLQDISANPNIEPATTLEVPKLGPSKVFTSFSGTFKKKSSKASLAKEKLSVIPSLTNKRSQLLSSSRSKKSPAEKHVVKGKSPRKHRNKENKENIIKGTSRTTENLRISRPRPQGRSRAAPAPRAMRL